MPLRYDSGPLGRNSIPTPPGTFREVKAHPTARTKKKVQIEVTRSVDLRYVAVQEAIKELATASEGLEDAMLDVEVYNDYGSESIDSTVRGWRDATDQEIQDKKDYDEWQAIQQKQYLERQAEQLRRQAPHLFKEK